MTPRNKQSLQAVFTRLRPGGRAGRRAPGHRDIVLRGARAGAPRPARRGRDRLCQRGGRRRGPRVGDGGVSKGPQLGAPPLKHVSVGMTSYRRRIIIVALLVLWLGTPFRAQPPATPPDLDAYVERVLRGFDVPGLALAIVRNGQVVVSKGYGVRKLGEAPVGRRADAVRDRLEHQAVHGDRAWPSRRRTEDRLGRAGRAVPAGLPDVGPVRDARAHDPRSARPPERPRARRGRSAVVAGVDLRSQGDRAAAPVHPARDELPLRVCVRQRAVSRRRRGDRSGQRPVVGGFRRHADPRESGHARQQRPAFGGGRRGQHREPARAHRPRRPRDQALRQRQHESCRRHQLERRRHGEVDDGAAGARPAGRRLAAVFREHVAAVDHAGDADAAGEPAARAGGAAWRTSAATRWGSTSTTIAGTRC